MDPTYDENMRKLRKTEFSHSVGKLQFVVHEASGHTAKLGQYVDVEAGT